MPVNERTHYMVLGCPPSSTAAQLRKEYLKLAKLWHTDVGSGSNEEKFKELTAAYTVLKDESRRRLYDRQLAAQLSKQCTVCHGLGTVYKTKSFTTKVTSTCPTCGGTGRKQ